MTAETSVVPALNPMDPNFFALDWETLFEVLITIVAPFWSETNYLPNIPLDLNLCRAFNAR